MRLTTRTVLVGAILISLLSFAKFSYCEKIDWAQPGTDIHQCYSDISALFSERGLDTGSWAYSSADNAVEYPVLQGTVMWLTAKFSDGNVHSYFRINVALLALLFIGSVLLLHRMKPELSYLYLLAPSGVLAMYINWDLWAIITTLLAIYWFDRDKEMLSAIALAVSIATKFFPIVLLIGAAVVYIREQRTKHLAQYLAITLGGYLLINLPFAVTTPAGWWRFFALNIHRQPDWGSLWLGLDIFGYHFSGFNVISILAILIPLLVTLIFLFSTQKTLSLAQSSPLFLLIVMTFGKVYSPQYVLWLAPLVVLALIGAPEKLAKTIPVFWFWQITEVLYQCAIWMHLAGLSGGHELIPESLYGSAIVIRIAGTVAMALSIARQHRIEKVLDPQRWPELPL